MDSKNYILKNISSFIKKNNNVRIRYGYDECTITHVIEVVPNNVYRLNDAYILWESEMFDKFIALYATENICFISDDALVGIENVECTLYGENYAQDSTEKEAIIFKQNVTLVQQKLCDSENKISVTAYDKRRKKIGQLSTIDI
jgi:hypothetical protein